MTRLEAFPGSMGVKPLRPKEGSAHPSGFCGARIFLVPALRASPWSTSATVGLPFSVPPSLITLRSWCRNINLLSIAYDFRPRLRSRLTLGRLALPRNPWAFGGQVSRLSLVTHASILSPDPSTAGLRRRFARYRMLPYHSTAKAVKSVASVNDSRPDTFSAQHHLTSELLRTL